jgi:cell wall-associated NlpC family hydrolase
LRLHTLSAILSSLTVLAVAATPAVAAETGGVAAATPTPAASGGATPTTPATPAKPVHTDPVTAPTPNITYTGPVYEKTATGQVVPYTPPPTSITTTPAAATAASSTTGGSPVSSSSPVVVVGVAAGPTVRPDLLVPGTLARYVDGIAAAPEDAPAVVQEIIWAGNQLIGLPYIYGGGHNAMFTSPGYDCSGTVSFALHGASLLPAPEDSSEFEAWGSRGVGRWVTIFANGGHAYMTVAGLRLDTSPANDPSNLEGPRWRPLRPENVGFVVRHPVGL